MSVDVPNAVSQDGRSSGYRAACETQGHRELQGGDASFRNLLRLDGRPRITGVQMAGLRCQLMRAEVGTVFCRPTGGSGMAAGPVASAGKVSLLPSGGAR